MDCNAFTGHRNKKKKKESNPDCIFCTSTYFLFLPQTSFSPKVGMAIFGNPPMLVPKLSGYFLGIPRGIAIQREDVPRYIVPCGPTPSPTFFGPTALQCKFQEKQGA